MSQNKQYYDTEEEQQGIFKFTDAYGNVYIGTYDKCMDYVLEADDEGIWSDVIKI